jgi:cytidylate kinase
MKCPRCKHIESKVIDSRESDDNKTIRRRRECLNCEARFTTYERIEIDPVIVVKKNGNRESFKREKLLSGLMKALEKRPVPAEDIELIINRIEEATKNLQKKEVETSLIGEFLMDELKKIDKVAYIRYASVYRRFDEINEFVKEINIIENNKKEVEDKNKDSDVFQIALDGPSASGKSTIAKRLAKNLHIDYLDTGAMYRALAFKILRDKIDYNNIADIKMLLNKTYIDYHDGNAYLDGKKLGDEIRTADVTKIASDISSHPEVRKKLVELQKKIGEKRSVVADGRDVGTNIFKDAKYKFFMTADMEVRAKRRYKELLKIDKNTDEKTILEDIKIRDHNDTNRKYNPLKKAIDAVEIDTTKLSINEVVKKIESYINKK